MQEFLGATTKDQIQIEESAQKTLVNQGKWSKLAVDIGSLLISADELPESFDSRDKWPKCQTLFEIRDQSRCGSCWAIGAATVMSARLCIGSNQTDQRQISGYDVLTCCPGCGHGCLGNGNKDMAFQQWVDRGFVTGTGYDAFLQDPVPSCKPYPFPLCAHYGHAPSLGVPSCNPQDGRFKADQCVQQCMDGYKKTYWKDIIKGMIWYTMAGEEDLMRDLITNGPVSVKITLMEDFFSYKSGVYHNVKGAALGGHIVNLMGWGVENGVKYWLVQNMWNEGWGEAGWCKIRRGTNEMGIESDGSAGLALPEYRGNNPNPSQP
jgi:cathepsin B